MMYGKDNAVTVPDVDLLTFLFDFEECHATDDTPLHAEAEDPATVLTKAQARSLAKQLASFLREHLGVGSEGPGRDVVTVVSSGQYCLASLFYGIVAAEGVYSAANSTAVVPELVRQIRDSKPKVVICSKDAAATCTAAADETGIPQSNVLIFESVPKPRLYSIDGAAECDFGGSLDWRRITDPTALEDSLVCLVYSSGTTGLPKGVRISHANMVAQCYIPSTMNRPVWKDSSAAFESRTLAHLPTTHISGIQGYFVNPFFDAGMVYWMPKFDFMAFVKYNATLRITTFFTVPPIYMAIAKYDFVTDQFATLRVACCGAASLSQGLQAAASKKLGGGDTLIVQNWGMSEATGAVTHLPPDQRDITGSISMLMPNIQMRLVDDDGRDVEPGKAGEALLKGPVITKGYFNNPDANKSTFTEDGWMYTGDVLRVEGDLLYLVDRKKDIIKAGEPVAPAEIEGILLSHPLIVDAAVVGLYSEDHGHALLRAYVVTAPGDREGLSADSINEFMKGQVSEKKQLKAGVVFLPAIPRSPAGKILRNKLDQELAN